MIKIRDAGKKWSSTDPLIVVLEASSLNEKSLRAKLGDANLARRFSNAMGLKPDPLEAGNILEGTISSKEEGRVFLAVLPKDRSQHSLLSFARETVKRALHWKVKSLGFFVLAGGKPMAEALGAAVSARSFAMPLYGKKREKEKKYSIENISIHPKGLSAAFEFGTRVAEGTNGVRYLGTLPPNELTPGGYGERLREIAKKEKYSLKFYPSSELKKMGAGCFTAVDQGNPDSKGGIYVLRYEPKGAKNKQPIALVGKGLCFDTGGYDVKVSSSMVTMKGDMQGSAVALETLRTVQRLKLPLRVEAYLAITENLISPLAYKPDDVVIALNGMSVEVTDTDAEGRMVLADTLTLASKAKPELIVDFATLTGCAVRAIGTTYGAAFTNRESLHSKIRASGDASGERVWTFPIGEEFAKDLESQIADLKQCKISPCPDHILAAFFLSRFVGDGIPWVHLDLSPSEREGGLAHVDSTFTGFGVLFAIELLSSWKKIKKYR